MSKCLNDTIEQLGPFRRIILCAGCVKRKAMGMIQELAAGERIRKDRVPDPDSNPNLDKESIFTSSSLSHNVQAWGRHQAETAEFLGLSTLTPKVLVGSTREYKCDECGEKIGRQREPKVMKCEKHLRAYRLAKNINYKRASRARGKNTD